MIVAEQDGGAPVLELNPTGEPQVTGLIRVAEPFLNCTVPVGAAPLLLGPITEAVSVTMEPAVTVAVLALMFVSVCAWEIVSASMLLDDWAVKLLSPA